MQTISAEADASVLEPHTLVFAANAWYLVAHDLKHDEVRRFRLDRMEAISLTETAFVRPSKEHLSTSRTAMHARVSR